MAEAWEVTQIDTKVIGTPKGDYTPKSDDLKMELEAAAKSCNYKSYRVFIDGVQVETPEQLYTDSIAALTQPARIEPYDKAA